MRYRKKNLIGTYFRLQKVFLPVIDKISGKIFMNAEIERNHKLKKMTFVLTQNRATILLNTLLIFYRDNSELLSSELKEVKEIWKEKRI